MAMELPPRCEPCKHPVFATDGDGLHGAFDGVVAQFQKAFIKIRARLGETVLGVANSLSQWRFAGYFGQLGV